MNKDLIEFIIKSKKAFILKALKGPLGDVYSQLIKEDQDEIEVYLVVDHKDLLVKVQREVTTTANCSCIGFGVSCDTPINLAKAECLLAFGSILKRAEMEGAIKQYIKACI